MYMQPKNGATKRFISGPQLDAFSEQAAATMVSDPYLISSESDRMGYRLKGPLLGHCVSPDIISDYIIPGSIQVPGSGQPIILMSDCQMTGGYAKIGVVIGVDIPCLAQRKPGDQVAFARIEIDEAQQLWKSQEQLITRLALNNC